VGFLASYEYRTQQGRPNIFEFGPLLEKRAGRFAHRLNLIWEKEVGSGAGHQYEFRGAYSLSYQWRQAFAPGLEVYYRPADDARQLGPVFYGELASARGSELEYSAGVLLRRKPRRAGTDSGVSTGITNSFEAYRNRLWSRRFSVAPAGHGYNLHGSRCRGFPGPPTRYTRSMHAKSPLETAAGNFQIRPSTAHDAALILDFIRELAEYEKLAHEVTATEQDIQAQLFGSKPKAECVIAELDGKPIGFALYFHNFSTFVGKPGLYLEDLYIKPEFRGRGYGRRLLSYLAKLAVARGCGRFEWAVLDWNAPAIRFYASLGAEMMQSWRINRLSGSALQKLAAETRD